MKEMTIINYLLFAWTPFVPHYLESLIEDMLLLMSKLVRKLKIVNCE